MGEDMVEENQALEMPLTTHRQTPLSVRSLKVKAKVMDGSTMNIGGSQVSWQQAGADFYRFANY